MRGLKYLSWVGLLKNVVLFKFHREFIKQHEIKRDIVKATLYNSLQIPFASYSFFFDLWTEGKH